MPWGPGLGTTALNTLTHIHTQYVRVLLHMAVSCRSLCLNSTTSAIPRATDADRLVSLPWLWALTMTAPLGCTKQILPEHITLGRCVSSLCSYQSHVTHLTHGWQEPQVPYFYTFESCYIHIGVTFFLSSLCPTTCVGKRHRSQCKDGPRVPWEELHGGGHRDGQWCHQARYQGPPRGKAETHASLPKVHNVNRRLTSWTCVYQVVQSGGKNIELAVIRRSQPLKVNTSHTHTHTHTLTFSALMLIRYPSMPSAFLNAEIPIKSTCFIHLQLLEATEIETLVAEIEKEKEEEADKKKQKKSS